MSEENDTFVISSLETLKDFIKSKDNAISNVYFSPIPEICKTEKCILGKMIKNLI